MSTPSYPVRLVGGDDLERSRLTVFFRLFLLIPHVIVLVVYAIAAFIATIVAWFAALFTGRVPHGLHDFIAGYLRYYIRVLAYGTILADPFPPFGAGGGYPVDLEIDPPVSQNRLTCLLPAAARAPVPDRPLRAAEPARPRRDRQLVRRAGHGRRARGPADARHVLPALQTRTQRLLSAAHSALPGLRRHARVAAADQTALPPLP